MIRQLFTCLAMLWCGSTFVATPAATIDLSAAERAFVVNNPVIRVGAETDWPPFDFTIAGQATGYSNDYLALLAEQAGIELEFVTGPPFSELISMAKNRDIDILPALWKNDERQDYLSFIPPYYHTSHAIFTNPQAGIAGIEDLPGRSLVGVAGYNSTKQLAEFFPDATITKVDSPLAALVTVNNGEADAFIGSLGVGSYYCGEHGLSAVTAIPDLAGSPFATNEALHIAVRKDWPELASILTKAQAALTNDQIQALRDQWIVFQNPPGVSWQSMLAWLGGGLTVMLVIIGTFLTWNRQLAQEVRERRAAEAEAAEANRAKSMFLANMSHEIRTPMNGISGLSELLQATKLNADQRLYLDQIRSCSDALLALVNDILDISKIEAGKVQLEKTTFDLHKTIESIVAVVRQAKPSETVTLTQTADDSIPAWVRGDPQRLGQCLTNLLTNAMKFTQAGRVTLAVTMDGDRVHFSVTDTGIGIAADRIEHIFDAFEQADLSTTREFGGTGLGLAITQQLVRLMGGTLQVTSEINKGSTFSFALPLEATHATTSQIKRQGVVPQSWTDTQVLVVEDNQVNVLVATRLLESFGITPHVANNGQEAINYLQSQAVDLVFMDCHMPVVDGFEATRLIRSSTVISNPHLPIIALTADAMEGAADNCRAAGMDDYLTKPIGREALAAMLARYLPSDTATDSTS